MKLMVAIASLFSTGQVMSSLVGLILVGLPISLTTAWRLLLGLGAVPSAIAFSLRLLMEETAVPAEDSGMGDPEAEAEAVEAEAPVLTRTPSSVILDDPWRGLVLVASLGFALHNVTSFGQGTFKSTIAESIYGNVGGARPIVRKDASFGLWIGLSTWA
eukprot:CAMPEP_0204557526 /NCGR_PEP_ID=MMETSP0661-20131031/30389_1 /ASSEMBLY_ACC=CAM_ASM_000606 /TAXON_ID=109239 /ORGANISM="Alexandrium margalefi, Strain AMGDE01CS-322" /LENGTH=158 /DNA_ID=CAMNT_0051564657 /DNA_START=38 /DNA_END=510 /DNA_ORIENTATION=+